MDRRIIGAKAQGARCRARRFARLLSLLLVSVIGNAQPGGDVRLEDEADHEERVVFRHFI